MAHHLFLAFHVWQLRNRFLLSFSHSSKATADSSQFLDSPSTLPLDWLHFSTIHCCILVLRRYKTMHIPVKYCYPDINTRSFLTAPKTVIASPEVGAEACIPVYALCANTIYSGMPAITSTSSWLSTVCGHLQVIFQTMLAVNRRSRRTNIIQSDTNLF